MGVRVEVRLPSEDEIASLVGSEHDELLLELERIGRMLEAAKLGVIDHADHRARFLADGHRSTAAWTRAITNCSPAESRRKVRAARALRDLSGFRDALTTGDVGIDQVNEIARLHARGVAVRSLIPRQYFCRRRANWSTPTCAWFRSAG